MRQSEELPFDPEILADLDAIDATLAGRIVDPLYNEIAEITLLLAAERPAIPGEVARRLDALVEGRFAPARAQRPKRRRRLVFGTALGGSVAAIAAAVVGIAAFAGAQKPVDNGLAATPSHSSSTGAPKGIAMPPKVPQPPLVHRAVPAPKPVLAPTPVPHLPIIRAAAPPPARKTSASPATASSLAPALTTPASAPLANATTPAPVPNGRRIVQSADIELAAANDHVADVAEEVFNVVNQYNGIVESSSVTSASGNGGYATFSLSIPSGNLEHAMTQLSELPYAHVSSRTDNSQDVNDQYLSDVRALQDARALRTALLKQLETAYTEEQIESLNAQVHDAEASISSDEATLNGLQHRISFSALTVEINAATPPPVSPKPSSSGFTLGRATHDALRVLTVVAGVSLIVLAALVPFALLVLLGAWISYWVRRRRREHALDAA